MEQTERYDLTQALQDKLCFSAMHFLLTTAYGVVLIFNLIGRIVMAKGTKKEGENKLSVLFWITLIRGFLVIALGASLLFTPEKTKAMLFNFMGFFWLMTGIVNVRQELHERGNRWVLLAGVLGVVAGIAVVTRDITRMYLAEFWVVEFLGIIILLTGILHIMDGFRVGRRAMHGRTTLSILLGIFEIFLGLVFVIFNGGQSQIIYTIGIIWALLGGILLLSDAFRQFRASRAS